MDTPTSRASMPSQYGRYRVQKVLGRGAMGMVYLGFDPLIERLVAIKVIRIPPWMTEEDVEMYRSRFFREARAAGQLQHPSIVTIYDMGIDESTQTPYIVMEYIDGENLKTRLENQGPLPWVEALTIMFHVAQGLSYAHRRGIVHRDIKPANIMITSERVCIADFGIARLPHSELTLSGQVIGSPSYMSPEQAMGHSASPLSDLFALGVTLFESLTGQKPFQGESFSQISYRILNDPPPDLRVLRPGLPEPVYALVERLLKKNPRDRFDSADILSREIAHILMSHASQLPQMLPPVRVVASTSDSLGSDTAIHHERTLQIYPLPVYKRLQAIFGHTLRRSSHAGALGIIFLLLFYGTVHGVLLKRFPSDPFRLTPPASRGYPGTPEQNVNQDVRQATSPLQLARAPGSQESRTSARSLSPSTVPIMTAGKPCPVTLSVHYPFRSMKIQVKIQDFILLESTLTPKKETLFGPIKKLVGESMVRFSLPPGDQTVRLFLWAKNYGAQRDVDLMCREGETLWMRVTITRERHRIVVHWGRSKKR